MIPTEEMSDHELLMELVAEKRRNDRIRYIYYGLYTVFAVFLIVMGCIYIPKIVRIVNQYKELMENYQQLIARLNATDGKINEFMNGFETDLGGIKEFIEKFSALMGAFGYGY